MCDPLFPFLFPRPLFLLYLFFLFTVILYSFLCFDDSVVPFSYHRFEARTTHSVSAEGSSDSGLGLPLFASRSQISVSGEGTFDVLESDGELSRERFELAERDGLPSVEGGTTFVRGKKVLSRSVALGGGFPVSHDAIQRYTWGSSVEFSDDDPLMDNERREDKVADVRRKSDAILLRLFLVFLPLFTCGF